VNRIRLAVAGLLLATLVSCSADGDKADPHIDFCLAAQSAKDAEDAQQRLFSQSLSPTPADVQPAVEGFASKFAAMAALAPKEIKADVDTISNAAQGLLAVVKASGYDVTAMVTTPEFATLTDTFASSAFTDAQDRFRNYVATTCGITITTEAVPTSDLTTTSGS
jgi:hypothetical protein